MRANPAGLFSGRSRRLAAAGLAVLFAAAAPGRLPAAPNELGHPVVREFSPGQAKIGHLCQAVTQDAAGFIYAANGGVIRCYDGATWRVIALPTESAGVRKFAVAPDGTVYAGGASLLGYLRGAGERAEFISLVDRLPPAERGFDDIFDVLAVGDAVYFATEEKILVWRDQGFTVVPCPTPLHSRGARLHRVGATVYVTAPGHALCALVQGRLEPVADDPVLRENPIIAVEAGPAGSRVLLTAERGFFQLAAGRVTSLPTEANRWLAGKGIFRALRLPDGSLAVAFTSVSGDGGMRFGADGAYLGPIDNSTGLYVKTLRDLFCDREGGLWLATETGLFRLEWPSAVTVFDAVNGVGQGAVDDVARHEGVLYAATSEGLFRLAASDATGRGARFERIAADPAYAVLSHPGGLLVAGYTDVFVWSAGGLTSVAKLPPGGAILSQSRRDPDRVLVATTRGMGSVRHTPAGWRDEGPAAEDDPQALPPEVPERFAPAGGGDAFWRASAGDIFREPLGGGEPRRLPRLVSAAAGAVGRMWEETEPAGTTLWICGSNGLVRVDVARAFPAAVPFAAVLRPVGVRAGDRISSEHAGLTFAYVALRHQLAGSVVYQTRLDGYDEDWSAWSPERARSFTGLPAGDYRFAVHARDADGRISAPAVLTFAVLARWWRTPWAVVAYAVAGVSLLGGVVRWRTHALRQRAGRLEAIVAQRTAELATRNTELVRLNRLELDEKISARLAEEKAHLEVLRYQLNPHFLFNALATISGLTVREPVAARAVTRQLAEFCRLTLTRGRHEFVTLEEEFQLLASYLDVLRAGREEAPEVVFALEPAAAGRTVPSFLLLPLAENAGKYGRRTADSPFRIEIAAHLRPADGALVVTVANTGTWVDEFADRGDLPSTRIGLENIRQRLARVYPGTHRFATAARDGRVTVEVTLPAPGAAASDGP